MLARETSALVPTTKVEQVSMTTNSPASPLASVTKRYADAQRIARLTKQEIGARVVARR